MVSGIGDRDGVIHLEDDGWRGRGVTRYTLHHGFHSFLLFSFFKSEIKISA